MDTEAKSSLTIYSLGIVIEGNTLNSDCITVSPIEHINLGESGYIKNSVKTRTGTLPDKDGVASAGQVKSSNYLTAKWLPLGQPNRSSPPNVAANDTVVLFKFGDDKEYWWVTLFRGIGAGGIRKGLETVNYSWSNVGKTSAAAAASTPSAANPVSTSGTSGTTSSTSTAHDAINQQSSSGSADTNLKPLKRIGSTRGKTPRNFSSELGIVTSNSDIRTFNDNSSYWFEVSTEDKHIILRTSSNDGEPTGWTFNLDTKAGVLLISDDDDNYIKVDNAAKKITFNSQLDIDVISKGSVNIKADRDINLTAKNNINMSAKEISMVKGKVLLSSDGMETRSGTITTNGVPAGGLISEMIINNNVIINGRLSVRDNIYGTVIGNINNDNSSAGG